MADYCWMLLRDILAASHKRKSTGRSLQGKSKRYHKHHWQPCMFYESNTRVIVF